MTPKTTTSTSRTRGEHGAPERRPRRRSEAEQPAEARVRAKSPRRTRRTADSTVTAGTRRGESDGALDSLQVFLNQASRFPLLTAAEEIELAKRIERGDMAAKDRMIN